MTAFMLPLTGSEPCSEIDPELFFIEQAETLMQVKPFLRQLCHGCPILDECHEHAIRHEEFGFWGGLTVDERRQERRRRGIVLESVSRYNMYVVSARNRELKEREQDDLRRLPTRRDLQYAVAKQKAARTDT